jgi:hypothetical protein
MRARCLLFKTMSNRKHKQNESQAEAQQEQPILR